MRTAFVLAAVASVTLVAAAPAQVHAAKAGLPRPDPADKVVGVYAGAVTADTSGAPQPGVTLTVTKVAIGTVQVASSYARMATFRVGLVQSGTTVTQASGANLFRVDESRTPYHLDVVSGGVTWSGDKR